jgi:hypothetical protein
MPEYEIGWKTREYHEKLIAKANEVGAIIRRPSEGETVRVSSDITLEIFNTLTNTCNCGIIFSNNCSSK